MKSRRSRVVRRWAAAPASLVHYDADSLAATSSQAEPPRERAPDQLGPYEARYDIMLGYGIERPIVRPS